MDSLFLKFNLIPVQTILLAAADLDMLQWPYTYLVPDAAYSDSVAALYDGLIGTTWYVDTQSTRYLDLASRYESLRPAIRDLLPEGVTTYTITPSFIFNYHMTYLAAYAIARKLEWGKV